VTHPIAQEIVHTLTDVFGELADLFGNPRSHGQVFGLLFSSLEPLTQEEIAERLQISHASTSLALRALESFGAVEKTPATGPRGQATYTAHTALRPLVLGFVKNRLVPKLAASQEKLAEAANLVSQLDRKEFAELRTRVERVQNWHKRAEQVLAGADQILKMVAR
jgi:DNA-binding transcriptional regulator GbsR (MarR family)